MDEQQVVDENEDQALEKLIEKQAKEIELKQQQEAEKAGKKISKAAKAPCSLILLCLILVNNAYFQPQTRSLKQIKNLQILQVFLCVG